MTLHLASSTSISPVSWCRNSKPGTCNTNSKSTLSLLTLQAFPQHTVHFNCSSPPSAPQSVSNSLPQLHNNCCAFTAKFCKTLVFSSMDPWSCTIQNKQNTFAQNEQIYCKTLFTPAIAYPSCLVFNKPLTMGTGEHAKLRL